MSETCIEEGPVKNIKLAINHQLDVYRYVWSVCCSLGQIFQKTASHLCTYCIHIVDNQMGGMDIYRSLETCLISRVDRTKCITIM